MTGISVIVPVYNIEAYIGECIESIIAQPDGELEIILVDDGSCDHSGEICDAYAQRDSRIRVIHKENGGLVSARKAGLLAANGEYISCVDGDDWIEPGMYQKLLSMGAGMDVIAFAGIEEYGAGGQCSVKKNTVKEGLYQEEGDRYRLYQEMMVNGNFYENGVLTYLWAKLVRRELLMECQMAVPDSVSYAEDAACVYPCLLKARSVYVSNEPLYHYRVRPGSMVKESVDTDSLSGVFTTLGNAFFFHPLKESLMRQLQYSMWHAMLLKRYGQISSPMALFPFEKVKEGMRVAVYGAGIFGKVMWEYGGKNGSIALTGWFDRRHGYYAAQGLWVQPPEEICQTQFDVIVVAILNIRLALQIKEELIQKGVPADRIDHVRLEKLENMELPAYMEAILAGNVRGSC